MFYSAKTLKVHPTAACLRQTSRTKERQLFLPGRWDKLPRSSWKRFPLTFFKPKKACVKKERTNVGIKAEQLRSRQETWCLIVRQSTTCQVLGGNTLKMVKLHLHSPLVQLFDNLKVRSVGLQSKRNTILLQRINIAFHYGFIRQCNSFSKTL